jgi:hypothetical protein
MAAKRQYRKASEMASEKYQTKSAACSWKNRRNGRNIGEKVCRLGKPGVTVAAAWRRRKAAKNNQAKMAAAVTWHAIGQAAESGNIEEISQRQ